MYSTQRHHGWLQTSLLCTGKLRILHLRSLISVREPTTRSLAWWCCRACTPAPCRSCCPRDPTSTRTSLGVSEKRKKISVKIVASVFNKLTEFIPGMSRSELFFKGRKEGYSRGALETISSTQVLGCQPTDRSNFVSANSQEKGRVDAAGKQGSRCCGEERIKDDGLSVPSPDETVIVRTHRLSHIPQCGNPPTAQARLIDR